VRAVGPVRSEGMEPITARALMQGVIA